MKQLVLFMISALAMSSCGIKTEAQLQRTFDDEAARFVALRDFVHANKITTIRFQTTTEVEPAQDEATLSQLTSLVGDLELKSIATTEDGDVFFLLDTLGALAVSATHRGVMWTEHPERRVQVKTLNEQRSKKMAIRSLGTSGWYMYQF